MKSDFRLDFLLLNPWFTNLWPDFFIAKSTVAYHGEEFIFSNSVLSKLHGSQVLMLNSPFIITKLHDMYYQECPQIMGKNRESQ